MDELKQIRKDLDELYFFANSINSINNFKEIIPSFLITADLYSLLGEIKYASGYIDCMIDCQKNVNSKNPML